MRAHGVDPRRDRNTAPALYVQHSACLLPARPEVVREVRRLADRIRHQGGTARILPMAFTDPADEHAVIAELNTARDAEYTEVLERLPELRKELADEQARGNATYAEVEESEAYLERFRTWLAKIAARCATRSGRAAVEQARPPRRQTPPTPPTPAEH